MKIKIGADPEVFVNKAGEQVSVHNLIPGTKQKPFPVKCGAIQVDGTATEFNIDPAETEDEFVTNIQTVMSELKSFLPEGYDFNHRIQHIFPTSVWEKIPEKVREVGCDPDFSAYKKKDNEPRIRPREKYGHVYVGGHIHIGWGEDMDAFSEPHMEMCKQIVKALDNKVGLYMTILDRTPAYNGLFARKMGVFRPKSYGVEYRTPSNAWLWREETIRDIYRLTQECLNDVFEGVDTTPWSGLHIGEGMSKKDFININGESERLMQIINKAEECLKIAI